MEINTLLADPRAICLKMIISHPQSVTLVVKAMRENAPYPQCGLPSRSIHSHYTRTVADLPWHGITVKLELQTRRFRCRNSLCARSVFCERLPAAVAHYGRQTVRLNEALTFLGFAL